MAEVDVAAGQFRQCAPDHFEAFDGILVEIQRAFGEGGATGFVVAGLHEADVDDAIVGEVGVKLDVAQATLTGIGHLGCTADLGLLAVLGHELDGAGLFRDQQATIGQEFVCPGLIELGDRRTDERVRFLTVGGDGNAEAQGKGEQFVHDVSSL